MEMMMRKLGEIITGNTPSKNNEEFWNSEDIYFIKPDIIADGEVNEICEANEYISEEARKKARIVSKNAIFITCIGSIGKIGIAVEGEYAFNQQINVIIPNKKVQPKYLAYNLLFNKPRLIAVANAPVVPIINKSQFANFTINIDMDTDRQAEVVEVLDKLTNVIKLREQELQLLDNLIKARFVEMFGDPSTNPRGWDETTISDECFYIKDGPHKSLPDIGKENGGHPFISVRNIVNGHIDFSTARYISDEDYADAIKKCHPEKGDMLYSKGGTTGIAKLIDIDEEFANWVHVAVLKFDKSRLNGVFFENMLNCSYCYEQSQRLTKGIANRDLVLSAMAQIKLYCPPMELQDEFADFVKQVVKSKVAVKKALDETQMLFDSLMQKYFA